MILVPAEALGIRARLAVVIAAMFLFDCAQAQEAQPLIQQAVQPQVQVTQQPQVPQPQIQVVRPPAQAIQQPLVQVQTVPSQVQQVQPQSQIQLVQPQPPIQKTKQPTMVQIQPQPQSQPQIQIVQPQAQLTQQPQVPQIQVVQPQVQQITQRPLVQVQAVPSQVEQGEKAIQPQQQAQPQAQLQIVQPQQLSPQIAQMTKQPAQPQPQAQVQPSPQQAQTQSQPQSIQIPAPAQPQTIVQMQPQSQPQTQTIVQVQSQPPQPQLQAQQPQGGQSQVQVVQVQVQPCAVQSCNICKPVEVAPPPPPPPVVKVTKPVKHRRAKLKVTPICYNCCEKEPIVVSRSPCLEKENKYQPYFEIGAGGVDYSDESAEGTSSIEFFSPIFVPSESAMFFTDLKVFDRFGSEFMGSAQFGYRRLLTHENILNQMVGIYASFDRMRSSHREYFNQLAFGGEYWLNEWFVGGNFYLPIGTKKKIFEETNIFGLYEEAARGVDAEIGYAITNKLTGYAGGFYFKGNDIESIRGIGARLEYLFYQGSERRFLGIFDSAKLVAGVKKFISKGTAGFIELKLGIGLGPCPRANLSAFESHMVDTIRRTSLIVTGVGDHPVVPSPDNNPPPLASNPSASADNSVTDNSTKKRNEGQTPSRRQLVWVENMNITIDNYIQRVEYNNTNSTNSSTP